MRLILCILILLFTTVQLLAAAPLTISSAHTIGTEAKLGKTAAVTNLKLTYQGTAPIITAPNTLKKLDFILTNDNDDAIELPPIMDNIHSDDITLANNTCDKVILSNTTQASCKFSLYYHPRDFREKALKLSVKGITNVESIDSNEVNLDLKSVPPSTDDNTNLVLSFNGANPIDSVIYKPQTLSFIVTNTGSKGVTVNSAIDNITDPDFSIVKNNCGNVVLGSNEGDTTCDFSLKYQPTHADEKTIDFSVYGLINDEKLIQSNTLNLQFKNSPPSENSELLLSYDGVNPLPVYDPQETKILRYTLQNIGNETLTISSLPAFKRPTDHCSAATLRPDEECTFTIKYQPQETSEDTIPLNLAATARISGTGNTIESNTVVVDIENKLFTLGPDEYKISLTRELTYPFIFTVENLSPQKLHLAISAQDTMKSPSYGKHLALSTGTLQGNISLQYAAFLFDNCFSNNYSKNFYLAANSSCKIYIHNQCPGNPYRGPSTPGFENLIDRCIIPGRDVALTLKDVDTGKVAYNFQIKIDYTDSLDDWEKYVDSQNFGD